MFRGHTVVQHKTDVLQIREHKSRGFFPTYNTYLLCVAPFLGRLIKSTEFIIKFLANMANRNNILLLNRNLCLVGTGRENIRNFTC